MCGRVQQDPYKILATGQLTVVNGAAAVALPVADAAKPAVALLLSNQSGGTVHIGLTGVTDLTGVAIPTARVELLPLAAVGAAVFVMNNSGADRTISFAWLGEV